MIRLGTRAGAPPLGLIFGAIGATFGAAVALLHLDRIPVTLCALKALTGLPCATCGSTRTLGRLAELDLEGALAMNPLVALFALGLAAWATLDLALLPRRRALVVEVGPGPARWLRAAAVLAVLANWAYLVAAGR